MTTVNNFISPPFFPCIYPKKKNKNWRRCSFYYWLSYTFSCFLFSFSVVYYSFSRYHFIYLFFCFCLPILWVFRLIWDYSRDDKTLLFSVDLGKHLPIYTHQPMVLLWSEKKNEKEEKEQKLNSFIQFSTHRILTTNKQTRNRQKEGVCAVICFALNREHSCFLKSILKS